MKNWFSWANFRALLPSFFAGTVVGILIVFCVRPSYRSIDTLSMLEATLGIVITALAILGAFVVVTTWNSIEYGVKRGIREYEEKAEKSKKDLDDKVEKVTNDLDEKMKSISGDLEYAKQMIDLLQQANEPGYMAMFRQHRLNKIADEGSHGQPEQP